MKPHVRSLEDVLLAAQKAGTLGKRPIVEVIEHARHFVQAIPLGTSTVIDIGSGGGVPGLVIAADRPELRITMVDRRATRMDALTRAVEALGFSSRVSVLTADAEELCRRAGFANGFDVAVCRGLGPPESTAKLARPFLSVPGMLIVSEPPDSGVNRWPEEMTSRFGFAAPSRAGSVVTLTTTA